MKTEIKGKVVAKLVEQLRKSDANAAFAETALRTIVADALEALDQRVRDLEPTAAPEEKTDV